MCLQTKEKIIEAFERLTLQLDKGYWREKHTSHHDSHQGKRKLRSFKKNLGSILRMLVIYTLRRNLLNWYNLALISKKLRFYVFGVVRIY